jgi:hypothetical protein
MYMASKLRRFLGLGPLFVLSAAAAFAQQPAPTASATPIGADDGRDDILFVVKLTAKELKMDAAPSTNVEFPGTKRRTTAWLTERQNLPDKLEPGVTYRDIGMTLRISSRFENIDEIVREALGEPPASGLVSATAVPKVPEPVVLPSEQARSKPKRARNRPLRR